MRRSGARWIKVASGILIAVASVLTTLPTCAASVVDSAEIRLAEQSADIEVKFNVPINLGAFAPSTHGELLQINVELPGGGAMNGAARLGATEWMAGSQPSAFTLYEYLRFDRTSEPNRGRIVIKFLHDVDFTVYQSADSRAIVISILKAKVPKVRPDKLPGQANLLPETLRAAQPAFDTAAVEPAADKPVEITVLPSAPSTNLSSAAAQETAAPQINNDADEGRAFTALSDYSPPAPAPLSTSADVQPDITDQGATETAQSTAATNDGWRVYGDFSQYYNYSDVKISRSGDPRFSTTDSQTSQNNVRSYLNLNARYRDDDWDIRSRFGGGYRNDFVDHSQDTFTSRYAGNKFLLSDAYVDVRNRRTDMSAKVGRQYGSTGGVFGRFDGAQVGVPIGGDWRASVVVGSPVDLIYDKTVDDTSSYFYGANFDFAPKDSHWQYSFYTIQETIDGVVGRRALGNETRYYGEGRSLLTLLDYDIEYRALNRAMAIGNWSPFKQTTVNATLDFGYSPLLTLRNALISQPDYRSIKDMQRIYSDADIAQFARDRTAKYHNLLIGVTQQLNELTQLYGSVGQYYYGSMPASGGVEAMPAMGNDYDYTLQYIRTSLLQENDTHSFGLHYYSGSMARSSGVGIDARYSWGNWRLNPRLWVERRNNLSDSSSEWVYRPGVRLEYSFLTRYHLEVEASSDIYQGKIPEIGTQDIVGNFVQIGYRIDLD